MVCLDMSLKQPFLLCLFSLVISVASGRTISYFNRTSFPADFIFGAGSAAYQYEGSPLMYGRGPSIWDQFVEDYPEKISDGSNASVANDFYHRFKEDIKVAKAIGVDSFRISISWSRILPKGKISGGVNKLGVDFYNAVIDEIVANGLKPFVTLFHFDNPQALEDEYGGLLSSKIVDDYKDYADFCFHTFGNRVKYWATVNEPNLFCQYGYDFGIVAPGRCSSYQGNCTAGNSATEPYVAAHHLLLLHAAGAKLYKEKYQAEQKGQIGITMSTNWYEPLQNTTADIQATSRALDFNIGWFVSPVTYGHYPESMRKLVGSRLPNFTEEQSETLRNYLDYLTINYYTASYAYSAASSPSVNLSYSSDGDYSTTGLRNNVPIGTPTGSFSYDYPEGLYRLLIYLKEEYKNPTIYITENGMADNGSLQLETALNDTARITYLKGHLSYLRDAIKDGVNAKGYYVWSFMDDWEWSAGYTSRYGIVYVNFATLTRYLKASANWYKKFLLP